MGDIFCLVLQSFLNNHIKTIILLVLIIIVFWLAVTAFEVFQEEKLREDLEEMYDEESKIHQVCEKQEESKEQE